MKRNGENSSGASGGDQGVKTRSRGKRHEAGMKEEGTKERRGCVGMLQKSAGERR